MNTLAGRTTRQRPRQIVRGAERKQTEDGRRQAERLTTQLTEPSPPATTSSRSRAAAASRATHSTPDRSPASMNSSRADGPKPRSTSVRQGPFTLRARGFPTTTTLPTALPGRIWVGLSHRRHEAEKSFGSQPDPQLNDAVRSGRLPRRHDSVDDLGRSGAKVEVRLDLGEFKKADLGRSVGPRREGGPELNCRGHRSVCDDRYAGARGRSVGHAAVPGGRASFGAWPDGDKPRVITLGPSRTSNNLTSTLATAGFPRSRDTIGPSR